MGSGSTGVAAVSLGRDFAGFDICAEAIDISSQRLEGAGGGNLGPTNAPKRLPALSSTPDLFID